MKDFEKYAHSFQVFPRLGLERISHLLAQFGDPQNDCGRILHVAGTNGKGSVAVALASILTRAGFRTGLYTSPNLVRVNERIVVDGAPISDGDLSRLISDIEAAARKTEAALGEMPTPFEIWTAAAFLHFRAVRCDRVVLEVGLGGAYDATNAVDRCELALLAHIDFDHTAQLGDTLAEIARAKCGIIKEGCRVLSVPQHPEVEAVIRRTCREKGVPLTFTPSPAPDRRDGFFEIVDLPGLPDLRLPFAGVHQIADCALAVTAAGALGVEARTVREGLAAARHPARMELLRRDPPLLYDGGHNPDGIRALLLSLRRCAPDTKWTVVFAAMRDKDVAPSLTALASVARRFVFTTVRDNPRALTPTELCERAAACGVAGDTADTLPAALEAADGPTLVCGSLYLYADLPPALRSL